MNWLMGYLFLMLLSNVSLAQFEGNGTADSGETKQIRLDVDKADYNDLSKKREMKDNEGFLFAVSRVLGKDQNDLRALNALAVHYIQKDSPGLAKIVLNRALEAHPDSHSAYNNLGVVYIGEGELRKAINSFKKATELKSGYEIGLANLGAIYVEYGDYPRAVEPLEEGYRVVKNAIEKRDENAVMVASNYGVALAGTGEFEKAEGIYKKILESDSRNVGVLYNYAALLIQNLRKAKEGRKTLSRLKFVADDKRILAKAKTLEAELESLENEKTE